MLNVTKSTLTEDNYGEYENLSCQVKHGVNLHPIWIGKYIKAFGYEGKEFLLEAREQVSGKLCGLLPLVRKDDQESRFVRHRRLVPAGYGPTDFFDIPALPGCESEVAAGLVTWLVANAGEWDQLMINLIPRETRAWELFVQHLSKSGFRPTTVSDRNFLRLDTSGLYGRYLDRLGVQKVKELRYYRNRLGKEGRLEVERITSGAAEYFDDFVSAYSSRRASKLQSDPYTRVAPLYHFIKAVIPEYEKNHWIRLSVLKLDKKIIAYCYHLVYQNVMYYYMPTILEEYKQFSPGKLLSMELIKDAFEDRSIKEFNFMRSEYSYKHWFAPSTEPYVTIACSNPRSYRNKALAVIVSARKARSKIIGKSSVS